MDELASQPSTDEVLGVIRNIARSGVRSLIFSGGEPLMREDLPLLAQTTKELGLHLGLLTNGVKFGEKPELCRQIVPEAAWIRVSLDGSTAEVYGAERGSISADSCFGKVIEGLHALRIARRANSGCRIGICYTITQGNYQDVGSMLRLYAHDRSLADNLVLKFAHCANGNGQAYVCTEDQVESVIAVLRGADSRLTHNTNVPFLLSLVEEDRYWSPADIASGKPLSRFYGRGLENEARAEQGLCCFTPYLFAVVDAKGDVYPCCHLYFDNQEVVGDWADKREGYRLGNLHKDSLISIWSGKGFAEFREGHANISPDECGECTRHFLDNAVLSELFAYYGRLCGDSRSTYRRVVAQKDKGDSKLFF